MKEIYAVTGGGSGMGFEIAKVLGQKSIVLIGGRTQSKIDKSVAELKEHGIEAYGMPCDVSDMTSVQAFADKAALLGTLKAVVNAAGVSPTMADAKTIYTINMLGTYNTMEAFFSQMGKGTVMVNIASMAGHAQIMNDDVLAVYNKAGQADFVSSAMSVYDDSHNAYNLSKRFVIEYTRSNCVKYAKVGARIVSISPGTFMTPMLSKEMETGLVKTIAQVTPVGRLGQPEEIASLTEYLISDKAGFITGTDVLIDGGYTPFKNVVLKNLLSERTFYISHKDFPFYPGV